MDAMDTIKWAADKAHWATETQLRYMSDFINKMGLIGEFNNFIVDKVEEDTADTITSNNTPLDFEIGGEG